MKPSATALGKLLHEGGFVEAPFTTNDLKKGKVKGVGDETYGKDSRVYIYLKTPERRRECETFLAKNNVTTVHKDYSPGSGVVEVSVRYFKGWHWDE